MRDLKMQESSLDARAEPTRNELTRQAGLDGDLTDRHMHLTEQTNIT